MINNLTFRKANLEDLPRIIEMLNDDFLGKNRENFSLPLPNCYIEAFNKINSSSDNFLLVADHPKQKVVATAQLTFISYLNRKGSKRVLIEAVRVDSKFRNQKIGEDLIEFSIKKAQEQGCSIAQLTTDKKRENAHRFYQKLGFEATHLGFKKQI